MGLRVALALAVLLAVAALLLRPCAVERRDALPRAAVPAAEVAQLQDSSRVFETDSTARVALDPQSSEPPAAAVQDADGAPEPRTGTTVTDEDDPLERVRVSASSGVEFFQVVSDELGRFTFGAVSVEPLLEATKSGWALVERTGVGRDARGRWQPVRLVLAPSATLHVRVVDAAGRPRAGESVRVSIAPEERFGGSPDRDPGGPRWPSGQTDEGGTAVLTDCPANLRLVVRHGGMEFAHVLGGRLSRGEASTIPAPIVLRPGEVRELELRLPRSVRARGRVTLPGGRPAVGAMVTLALLQPPDHPGAEPQDYGFTDAEARFDLELLPADAPREVELRAEAGEDGRMPHSMFQIKRPDPLHVARLRRTWPDEPDAVWEVDLVLERAGTIAGLVLDAQGRPTSAEGELTPALAVGRPHTSNAGSRGELRFSGLLEPSYSLVVRKPGRAAVRLDGLVPDGAPFTVRLTEPASARVVVRVSSAENLAQTIVLAAELTPRAGREVQAPDLPASVRIDAPKGWPSRALGLWYGSMNFATDDGDVDCSLSPIDGLEKVFEVDGGLWWFGAQARTRDGNLLFPVGTGLVRVTPGEHVVELLLVPTGSLEGRFAGAADELWVALAGPGMAPIELDVRAEALSPLHRCASDGSFAWPMVPAGVLELRWGTREEMIAGRAAGSRAVEVRRGETARVEIEP